VVVLDEAGMAPTRLTARLLAVAEQAGAKVVAIGDPGQLGSVQAGGWLAALTTKDGQPTLRQAVRQQDASEREALQALHDGDPDAYLEHKHDQITVHDYETGAVAELTQQWSNARQEHGPAAAVMIARDNYTRELANRAARTQLKREGALAPLGVFLGGREYAPGDRVIARSNHRRHDLDNGTLATVIHINPATGAMLLETDAGEPRALDPQYVAEHLQHAYALTAHSAQGSTFQWAGVIGRPQEFTREWAYTALSRARRHTTIHLVAEPPEREREREEYAPPEPARDVTQALHAAMKRNESEALALANAPPEHPEPERNGLTAPHPSSSAAPTLKGVHHLRRSRQRDRPSLHL
jgi:ATP-dependent exoDNAse (exonuclease V) alpha subunit